MNWRTCGESMLPRPSLAPRSDCSRLFACWRSSAISEYGYHAVGQEKRAPHIMAKRAAPCPPRNHFQRQAAPSSARLRHGPSPRRLYRAMMHDRHEITDCGELCNMTKLVEGAIKRCDRAALVIVGNPFSTSIVRSSPPLRPQKGGPFTQYLITFLRNGGVMTGNQPNKRCTLFFRSLLFPSLTP